MKKLFYIAFIALTFLSQGCTKDGISASIVGTWEPVSMSYHFYNKDGNLVASSEVVSAIFKEMDMPTDERSINSAVEMLENAPVESTRFQYDSDGTVKMLTKNTDGTWSTPIDYGNYKLEGSKLILVVLNSTLVQTVLALNQNEMKIESTKDSIVSLSSDMKEALSVYEKLGYSWRSLVVYKRVR